MATLIVGLSVSPVRVRGPALVVSITLKAEAAALRGRLCRTLSLHLWAGPSNIPSTPGGVSPCEIRPQADDNRTLVITQREYSTTNCATYVCTVQHYVQHTIHHVVVQYTVQYYILAFPRYFQNVFLPNMGPTI